MKADYKKFKQKVQQLRKTFDASLKSRASGPDSSKPKYMDVESQKVLAQTQEKINPFRQIKKELKQMQKEIAEEIYKYYGAYRTIQKTYIRIRAKIDEMIKGHYGQYQASKFHDLTGVDAIDP